MNYSLDREVQTNTSFQCIMHVNDDGIELINLKPNE
jgi:hypothetical protein